LICCLESIDLLLEGPCRSLFALLESLGLGTLAVLGVLNDFLASLAELVLFPLLESLGSTGEVGVFFEEISELLVVLGCQLLGDFPDGVLVFEQPRQFA